jgi:hypothetical protein
MNQTICEIKSAVCSVRVRIFFISKSLNFLYLVYFEWQYYPKGFVNIKPMKTNKIPPHKLLLKADLDRIHSYLKKQKYNNKNSTHPHALHAPPLVSHMPLKNIPKTIDTHALIDSWWRREKRGWNNIIGFRSVFCFLIVHFLRANHRSMVEELSSIKKNCHYGKASEWDCD